jgi:hypothetical protein
MIVVAVFVVGDPGRIDNAVVSPINPGREEPIEGAATMAGVVRARSEEKDRCNIVFGTQSVGETTSANKKDKRGENKNKGIGWLIQFEHK